jgi:hypothetical protein
MRRMQTTENNRDGCAAHGSAPGVRRPSTESPACKGAVAGGAPTRLTSTGANLSKIETCTTSVGLDIIARLAAVLEIEAYELAQATDRAEAISGLRGAVRGSAGAAALTVVLNYRMRRRSPALFRRPREQCAAPGQSGSLGRARPRQRREACRTNGNCSMAHQSYSTTTFIDISGRCRRLCFSRLNRRLHATASWLCPAGTGMPHFWMMSCVCVTSAARRPSPR